MESRRHLSSEQITLHCLTNLHFQQHALHYISCSSLPLYSSNVRTIPTDTAYMQRWGNSCTFKKRGSKDWNQSISQNMLKGLYPCNSKPLDWYELGCHFFSSQRKKNYICISSSIWLVLPPFSFSWSLLFSVALSFPPCGQSCVVKKFCLIWEGKQREKHYLFCVCI